ncbi:hypothetical protein Avbf_06769, partial [Armadillidium vulgare]
MEKWNGRVALVTGASSGIGSAVCEYLVKNGMKVVGAARRIERLEDLAEKVKNEKGSFLPVKCDVTKDEDIYALFGKIKETFGGVDMVHQRNGAKLLILAGHYIDNIETLHFYTGSKFALRALSEGLRQELQAANSGIKLSVISPGLVKTEILQNIPKDCDFSEKVMEMNPWMKSEDIALSVVQILSAPSYME